MTAKIVDGRKIAENIRKKTAEEVEYLKLKYKITPNITTIKIGEDSSSELYLRLRDNACKKAGITSSHLEFLEDVSEGEILRFIDELNSNKDVHGILIQFPIPEHISSNKLMSAIDPKKDVEGFNPYNMGKTLIGDERIVPCTPLAILTILEHEKTNLKGREVVIVNHSTVVGKPLVALLLNRNATVSICHIFTKDTKQHTSKADIIITATGLPGFITEDYVKNGAFVIDIGIAETKDGIRGDVNFDSVKEKAGKITPVPGGVGPVTVACSLKNMLKTYKNCVKEKQG
jgi:methylenetetrahydrofolate dehydrogenase (NADP+)/methenyltetrahydrofolate cyclohydrolase